MIISGDAEKAFNKSQHALLIKLNKLGVEENVLNLIRSICDKLVVEILFKKNFPFKLKNSLYTISFWFQMNNLVTHQLCTY